MSDESRLFSRERTQQLRELAECIRETEGVDAVPNILLLNDAADEIDALADELSSLKSGLLGLTRYQAGFHHENLWHQTEPDGRWVAYEDICELLEEA